MLSRLLDPRFRSDLSATLLFGGSILIGLAAASPAYSQDVTPLARVQALGLDSAQVGRVTVYFAAPARERAMELGRLAEGAAGFAERELGVAFDLRIAALEPEHWFSEHPGAPYAIPWVSVSERLLFVQSSLTEGFMVSGPTRRHDRYRIGFGLLHEHGHLVERAYFRPESPRDDLVPWFGELLANYIAYAYLHTAAPQWAEAAKEMWRNVVQGYTPSELTLDWSFMNDLPPQELPRTYGWYQNLLNLRAAALYETHGLGLLRTIEEQLAWEDTTNWTSSSLLEALDEIAPGFQAWSVDLTNPEYLPGLTRSVWPESRH